MMEVFFVVITDGDLMGTEPVDIPQLVDGDDLKSISQNPRSSCGSFPTKVINGVLFVWASNDKDAVLESEFTPVTYRPADKEEGTWTGPWNYRELPYGHDFFQENVVDPAHVSISHHNIVGSRYNDQTQRPSIIQPLTKSGFSFASVSPNAPPGRTEFHAPCLVTPISETEGVKQVLELYSSPSRPGFCNHVGRIVIVKSDKNVELPIGLKQFTLPIPKWVNHVLASAFLNQDALFLHHQERYMHNTNQYSRVGTGDDEKQSNGSIQAYSKAVYPVQTDLGVMNYRKWISKFAGGGIPYRNNPLMPEASNQVVFDVCWNAHTKHCKYCQDAERRIRKVRIASFILAAFFGVLRPIGRIPSTVATLAFTGLGYGLYKLGGLFHKYEFSHSKND